MSEFKLNPEKLNDLKNQAMILTWSITGIVITSIIIYVSYSDRDNLAAAIIVFLVILPWTAYKSWQGRNSVLQDYKLIIGDSSVSREQKDTRTINIPFSDIREITKNYNGSFTIKGRNNVEVIGVPAQIENYTEVETILSQIRTLNIKTKNSFYQVKVIATVLFVFGLMVTVYLSKNKLLVGVTGTTLIGIMIWSAIKIQRSKNVDSRMKRASLWLILVLLSIVAILYSKLSAH